MKPTDIFIYLFPIVTILGIWFYFLKRKQKPAKNLFRTGQPSKLTKRIEIENHLSREDFIKTNGQLTNKTFLTRGRKIFFGFIAFGLVVNLISSPFLIKNYTFDYSSVIVPLVFVISLVVFYRFGIKNTAGRLYDSTEFIKNKVKYIFDADSYEIISSLTTVKSGWEGVQGFVDTDKHLLVFTGPTQALFLDKSCFAAGDLDTFKAFLNDNFEIKMKLY